MPAPRFDFTAPVPSADELGPVHFIAIGGSGVSGVARMFLARGVPVSGSDRSDSPTLQALADAGATVHVGHDPGHLGRARTVIISGAVQEDNPELAAARAAGLRVLHRAQGIATLLAGRPVLAVAGANGKTTTSAMAVAALESAGTEPGYVIGAPLAGSGTSAGPGSSQGPVVVEADESDGSFLVYRPSVAIVTNVQPDHLDFYGDLAAVEQAYLDFARTIRPGGLLITHADDPGAARLAERARAEGIRVLTWGLAHHEDAREADAPDLVLDDVASQGMQSSGTLTWTRDLGPVTAGTTLTLQLPLPGEHNVHNATAVVLAGTAGLGLPPDRLVRGLEGFAGAHRRFELVGRSTGGVEVVDDYAHNAPKVAAVVRAARSAADGRRVVVAFQPHLYSRTQAFAAEFADALAKADVVVLLPIYGARESAERFPGITSGLLADLVRDRAEAPQVHEATGLADAAERLAGLLRGADDLVVTVGAGDITRVGPMLMDLLDTSGDDT